MRLGWSEATKTQRKQHQRQNPSSNPNLVRWTFEKERLVWEVYIHSDCSFLIITEGAVLRTIVVVDTAGFFLKADAVRYNLDITD